MNDPYARFAAEELIIRDLLAVDRTEMANERTLLSWVRTALALALAGASCVHFIGGVGATILGSVLIALAVGCMVFGGMRYAKVKRMIARIKAGAPRASGMVDLGDRGRAARAAVAESAELQKV
jgi:putative membrane protein